MSHILAFSVLFGFLAATSSGVFLPTPISYFREMCRINQSSGQQRLMGNSFRPLFCFLFPGLSMKPNANVSTTPATTLKPDQVPHVCLTDANQIPCSIDIKEKCPRTFNEYSKREEEGVACARSEQTVILPPELRYRNFQTYILRMDSPGNRAAVRGDPDDEPPTVTSTTDPTNRPISSISSNQPYVVGGVCKGPFMCEYSPLMNQFLCPKQIAPKGVCIPLRNLG